MITKLTILLPRLVVVLICLFNVGNCAVLTFNYPEASTFINMLNGHIIRSQKLPNGIAGFKNFVDAWQIMYRSENTRGQAIAGTTTVVIPKHANSYKITSIQFPEDAPCDLCAPSVQIQKSSRALDAVGKKLLIKGYTLVIPDHQGPYNVFGAGIAEAKLTLDSMRAVLNSKTITGIPRTAKFTMTGFSGGSIPSGWAAQILDTYAPDLKKNAVGAAVGGFVVDLESTFRKTQRSFASGLIAAGFVGISNEYPEVKDILDKEIKQGRSSKFYKVRDQCSKQNFITFANENMLGYFHSGSKTMSNPTFVKVMNELKMGSKTPSIPMFVYQSDFDEIVDINAVDNVVNQWCRAGESSSVHYTRLRGLRHTASFNRATDATIEFLTQALDGKYVNSRGCKYDRRLSSVFTPSDTSKYFKSGLYQMVYEWDKTFGGSELTDDEL